MSALIPYPLIVYIIIVPQLNGTVLNPSYILITLPPTGVELLMSRCALHLWPGHAKCRLSHVQTKRKPAGKMEEAS